MLVLATFRLAACCGSASLGTPCSDGVRVISPALECRSHLCLRGQCTTECSSDHDCTGAGTPSCNGGAICARVDGFPRALCACRDQAAW